MEFILKSDSNNKITKISHRKKRKNQVGRIPPKNKNIERVVGKKRKYNHETGK
jgi:hypothetical protein